MKKTNKYMRQNKISDKVKDEITPTPFKYIDEDIEESEIDNTLDAMAIIIPNN